MTASQTIFLASVGLIAAAYLGYPLLVAVLAWRFGKPLSPSQPAPTHVSVVVAAHNESATIARRLTELSRLIASLDPDSHVILVSDGSTDGTDDIGRRLADPRIRVLELPTNMGKAVALNTGVAAATGEIIVFADARQTWTDQTIPRLLANYRDPRVGAVSGDLVLHHPDGSLAGVGLYWKLEKWIRRCESQLHSSVQVAGAISSVRRELYRPLLPGTILDDVCWPLSVVMQGYRVIHDPCARAVDRLPDRPRDEMRRKVRTLAGNFQLLAINPQIILPWRNPLWFAVIGHKLLRLAVPWAMIAALVASILAADPWLRLALYAQLAGYAIGTSALVFKSMTRLPFVGAISSLLILNTAALLAWFVYLTGQTSRTWKATPYARLPLNQHSTINTQSSTA